MLSLETLSDTIEIQKLKARYLRAGDTKDWALFRTCFADDFSCQFEGMPREGPDSPSTHAMQGADDFVRLTAELMTDIQGVHQVCLPEITLTGPATAKGIWAIHDYLVMPHCLFKGWGHYHEDYVKVGDEWKIHRLVVTRTRVEETWI